MCDAAMCACGTVIFVCGSCNVCVMLCVGSVVCDMIVEGLPAGLWVNLKILQT